MAPVPPFKNQGFGNWLNNNGDMLLQSGLGLLSGRTAPDQAAMGMKGFSDARKQNRTVELLRSANPDLAQAVETGALGAGDALKLHYERKMKNSDPSYQLDQDYKRAQIEALRAKPVDGWKRLDDGRLFRESTGEIKEAGAVAGGDGQFRFDGKSVEAQALNGLMDAGTLTPAQAQQLGAGKTIAGPNGEIIFMTPQGVFGQSADGTTSPISPSQTSVAPHAAGGADIFGGESGPVQTTAAPKPTQTQTPQRQGMISLTAPKPQNNQLPAEMGARIGLGDAFLENLPSIRGQIQRGDASGILNGAGLALGVGEPAEIWRNIESGKEALVRNLTGAGMAQSEAQNQAARYQISPTDTKETMLKKLDGLERDLRATRKGAIEARTGQMGEAPSGGSKRLKFDPSTGDFK